MADENKQKGDILENLVHNVFKVTGVQAEHDVHLPATDRSGRTRQIDVLLSVAADELGNCPVRFPIECKNYGRKIGIEDIDCFFGKLHDVGIETKFGIFVAVSGYTSDAMDRAKSAGIRLLYAEGLTEERLALKIHDVLHGVVFWVATWTISSSFHYLPVPAPEPGYCDFHVETGRSMQDWMTEALDEIWKLWISGQVPCKFAEYSVCVTSDNGGPVISDLVVRAHGIKLGGRVRSATLRVADTGKVERQHVQAETDLPEGTTLLSAYANEKELEGELAGSAMRLDVRTPRIIGPEMFWPPTVETMQRLVEYVERGERPGFNDLEGRNLLRAWAYRE